MVRTTKYRYRDSIEYRDTFSRYVSWHKISGIAQHYFSLGNVAGEGSFVMTNVQFSDSDAVDLNECNCELC